MFEYPEGATPLDLDEADGLIPLHITTHAQLNEWEHDNILKAETWLTRYKIETETVIALDFVKELHHRMFDKTWSWAGKFRQSNKNIGVDWPIINVTLKNLLDDIDYQIVNNIYPTVELAARFHHRLVAIHAFANGNGRHSRLMTDLLLRSLGQPRFTWGRQQELTNNSKIRTQYIAALRAADRHDYSHLLEFVSK